MCVVKESFPKSFQCLTRNETSHLILNITHVSAADRLLIGQMAPGWPLIGCGGAKLKIHRTEMYLNMAIQDVSKHHHHPPDAAWNIILGDALKIICN